MHRFEWPEGAKLPTTVIGVVQQTTFYENPQLGDEGHLIACRHGAWYKTPWYELPTAQCLNTYYHAMGIKIWYGEITTTAGTKMVIGGSIDTQFVHAVAHFRDILHNFTLGNPETLNEIAELRVYLDAVDEDTPAERG